MISSNLLVCILKAFAASSPCLAFAVLSTPALFAQSSFASSCSSIGSPKPKLCFIGTLFCVSIASFCMFFSCFKSDLPCAFAFAVLVLIAGMHHSNTFCIASITIAIASIVLLTFFMLNKFFSAIFCFFWCFFCFVFSVLAWPCSSFSSKNSFVLISFDTCPTLDLLCSVAGHSSPLDPLLGLFWCKVSPLGTFDLLISPSETSISFVVLILKSKNWYRSIRLSMGDNMHFHRAFLFLGSRVGPRLFSWCFLLFGFCFACCRCMHVMPFAVLLFICRCTHVTPFAVFLPHTGSHFCCCTHFMPFVFLHHSIFQVHTLFHLHGPNFGSPVLILRQAHLSLGSTVGSVLVHFQDVVGGWKKLMPQLSHAALSHSLTSPLCSTLSKSCLRQTSCLPQAFAASSPRLAFAVLAFTALFAQSLAASSPLWAFAVLPVTALFSQSSLAPIVDQLPRISALLCSLVYSLPCCHTLYEIN
mmetsp:Transcript_20690/g.30747  ORF Transcript_20690/g.30747 Transcript_20690/m.30747 type:complete len:472 (-) Transcript_20690:59-1474(-)